MQRQPEPLLLFARRTRELGAAPDAWSSSVAGASRTSRKHCTPLQEDHERIEQRLDALTAAALEPLELGEHEIAVVRALTDYDAWAALRERGITGPDAVDVIAGLLEGWLR